ncbi:DUF501 domain-containing protein [Selenihalanaerobacter shriftii]|uniref:DUF501 domain-containing protein n=1 Tax=Selenihalanaerobacter shriftii TaxID=142842 RepID=A0A1T4R4P2_9FIRM|nr:DUF501 domain-containing protein [Selenihalanaerobacter shriftii]SKA11020.1 hypothetical protein SAMN02745118_02824 [Selenihalanaerobacter shriftii]
MVKEYTEEDLEVIIRQLGREPRGLVKIAKRCKHGYPQILVTYPIYDKEDDIGIFPTTYWLSCPELIDRISELESEGLIKEIQEKIISDKNKFAELLSVYKDYAQKRIDLLTEDDLQNIKDNFPGRWKVISESGVGGIMEKEGIKCLHTQYADYLINQKNPVGRVINQLLTERFTNSCTEECNCYCSG